MCLFRLYKYTKGYIIKGFYVDNGNISVYKVHIMQLVKAVVLTVQ